eukprot:TRINITY_DN7768_c0_g1_i1.p1 TRINITY_DN7768_c0_g1~~TRINITY_DN7768_c0_g1_i1.p1  ORF type:complete len:206 (+),score=73.34 TRINITY_DN7768_c0_g1_i1:86-703(+)
MSQAFKFERKLNRKNDRRARQKVEGRTWKKNGLAMKAAQANQKSQDRKVQSDLTKAFSQIGVNAYVGWKNTTRDQEVHEVVKLDAYKRMVWFNPNDEDVSSDEDDFSLSTLSDNSLKNPFVVLNPEIDVEFANIDEDNASLEITLNFGHEETASFHCQRNQHTNDLTFTDMEEFLRKQSEKELSKNKKSSKKAARKNTNAVFFFA